MPSIPLFAPRPVYDDVDPAAFNDPLALKTKWDPINYGGTTFQSYQSILVNPQRLEFRSTSANNALAWVFIGIAGIALLSILSSLVTDPFALNQAFGLKILITVICGAIGISLRKKNAEKVIFDKAAGPGYFWIGLPDPKPPFPANPNRYIALAEIGALQIVKEVVVIESDANPSEVRRIRRFDSFELNVVLKSGDRINVVDYGAKDKLLAEARLLARFLEVPLWDKAPGKG